MPYLIAFALIAIVVVAALFFLSWIALALFARTLTSVVLYWACTALLGLVLGFGAGLLAPFLILTGRAGTAPLQLCPADVAAGRVAGGKPGGPNREHGWDRAWPNYLPYQARHDADAITRELRSRANRVTVLVRFGVSRAKGIRRDAGRPDATQPGTTRSEGAHPGVPRPGAVRGGTAAAGQAHGAPAGNSGKRGQLPWFLLRALMLLPGSLAFLLGLWGMAFLWFTVMGTIGALARCVQALLIWVTQCRQRTQLRRNRISASCPHCHARTTLPGFRCDGNGCGVVHWTLRPGPLGVFTRRCECGTRLPSSTVAAARRLRPVCPYCESELPAGSGGRQSLQIGVIGSAGAGKSRLLAAMLDDAAQFVESRGGSLRPLDEPAARFLAGAVELHRQQSPTMKTAHETPIGLPFLIESGGSCAEVQIMDAAGESFSSWRETERLRYLDASQTLVFALDPLVLPGVRARFERSAIAVPPAEGDQEEAYAAAVDRMRADRLAVAGKRLAVVLTKADVLISLPGCAQLAGAQGEAISEWLSSVGEELLVRRLRKDFGEVRFFLTDSMGDRDPADPASPLAVLRWILDGSHAGVFGPAARDSHALTVLTREGAAGGNGDERTAGDGGAQGREDALTEGEAGGNAELAGDPGTRIPAAYLAHRRAWLALHLVMTLCCAAALAWFVLSDLPRQLAEDGMSWLTGLQEQFSTRVPFPWTYSSS